MDYNALFIGSSTKDMIMLVDAPPESDQRISASQFVIFGGRRKHCRCRTSQAWRKNSFDFYRRRR